MNDEYFYVHKSVLPDFFEKVIQVKQMLSSGEMRDVSSAVRAVGISRSTYYKYKDHVFESAEVSGSRTAVISTMLSHEPGTLSNLLAKISDAGGSIITITQSVPIHGRAEVTISLDASGLNCTVDELVTRLGAKLLAIE